MIRLIEVSKTFRSRGVATVVAERVSFNIPQRGAIALIGRNGTGKSSLLRMIGGIIQPDSGRIQSDGKISWPVGFAGGFHPDLTGLQNARFVGRIYGVDTGELTAFVEDFAELGEHFRLPFRHYSSGMRARLGFAVSMGIEFDTYLIDEVTSVGDVSFRKKCEEMLRLRLERSSAVVVSHSVGILRRLCTAAVYLNKGDATWYDSVDDAIAVHEKNMKVGAA